MRPDSAQCGGAGGGRGVLSDFTADRRSEQAWREKPECGVYLTASGLQHTQRSHDTAAASVQLQSPVRSNPTRGRGFHVSPLYRYVWWQTLSCDCGLKQQPGQVRDLTGKDLSNELSARVCYQPPAMRITLSEALIGCDLYPWKLSTFLWFSFNASKVSLQQQLKISQAVTEIYFIVPEKDKKAWQKTQETGLTETLLCNANIQFPALQIKTTAARRGRFPLFVHPPPSVNERSPRNGFLCDCNINMINWNRDAGVSFHPRQTVISRIPRYADFSPLRARIIGVELKMPRQVGSCSTSKWISAACCERVWAVRPGPVFTEKGGDSEMRNFK